MKQPTSMTKPLDPVQKGAVIAARADDNTPFDEKVVRLVELGLSFGRAEHELKRDANYDKLNDILGGALG